MKNIYDIALALIGQTSPDGSKIVKTTTEATGISAITENGQEAFYSPSGAFIGFYDKF